MTAWVHARRYRAGILVTLLLLAAALAAPGCGGASRAQKRAYKAEEAVSKQRLQLIDNYQRCMRKAGGDPLKQDGCKTYLNAAEALD